jgi:two-component system CheB/CheR fusion protein
LLRAGKLDEGRMERALEAIERNTRLQAKMVEDLLDVSRITQGKIQLRLEPQDLAPILERSAEAWRKRFGQADLALDLKLPDEPVMALVDSVRIEQVVGNLLGNALKFTPAGGHVVIDCDGADNEWVTLRVTDDGKGIEPGELPRVFDLFMQVDRSLSRTQGGLGIGLTLVKRLIELHGGSVEARSDGPGMGAVFSLHLPRLAAMPSRTPLPAAPRETARQLRILVVDDNVDGAISWSMLLRLRGHEVEIAHDGPAALERAQGFRPEVALVDIGLPGMDGFEVGKRLREADSDRLLLIAVSGYAAEDDRRKSKAAGFDHHFRKPLDPDVLFNLLENGYAAD